MSSVIAYPRPRRLVLADLLPGSVLRDVVLIFGAAGFVGLLAQFTIHLSFTPVPITGQTLGVLLSGTALGVRRGAAAMIVYGVLGVIGVPWFADRASGYVGASFGYIVGFVVCATACGWLAETGADRSVLKALPAMVIGDVLLYTVGVIWLGVSLHVGAGKAISLGFTPFVVGDSIKVVIAALLLPGAWKLAGDKRTKSEEHISGKRL